MESGLVFIAMVIVGFILFIAAGFVCLSIFGNYALSGYLVLAAVGAFACCFKSGLRGLGAGILLGLSAVMLLLSICSGFRAVVDP